MGAWSGSESSVKAIAQRHNNINGTGGQHTWHKYVFVDGEVSLAFSPLGLGRSQPRATAAYCTFSASTATATATATASVTTARIFSENLTR